MKTNILSNSEIKKNAKVEVKNVNTNPTYNMRKINKLATGKDVDFNQGGFWWVRLWQEMAIF